VSAHGWLSPGGYTALPMRNPTTRMSVVFIGADNKGGGWRESIGFFQPACCRWPTGGHRCTGAIL